jgi:hypothetical protein
MAVIGGTEIVASWLRGTNGVTSLNGLTGAVIFAAGTGITLTPAGNTVTIASTASGASVIANGNATLSVTAIPANTAQSVVTVAATGVLATDSIEWAFNAIPGTGYNQGLYVLAYPSAGAVNFLVVNGTANAYTPAAAVLNWRVVR